MEAEDGTYTLAVGASSDHAALSSHVGSNENGILSERQKPKLVT